VSVRIRRAEPNDVAFLLELINDEDVDPYLAVVRPRDGDALLDEIERSQREPEAFGRFVIEIEDQGERLRAGVMGFELRNRRSRIAHLGNLAIHPDFRGRHLADEAARLLQDHLLDDLGFHRLELEIYGFNDRALRHAERAGFVREGVRRKAYWRHGEWVDGVLFGLVREDRGVKPVDAYISAHNDAVKSGDWRAFAQWFTDDAEVRFEGASVGPFRGREEIRRAYEEQPPDDEVEIRNVRANGDRTIADYGWAADGGIRAGELRLTWDGELIRELVITFE
jgi:RimJ/RimL family protein N-acetyltransferase/ketosteroid isomerase-like protein